MTLEEMRALGLIETCDCRYGRMSFLRTDQYIALSLGYYAEFSEAEIEVWRRLLDDSSNVVSAGANIGAHVVWFAKHCRKVFTVEPRKELYEILEENIRQNALDNVTARNAALGSVSGTTTIPKLDPRYGFNFGGVGTRDDPAGVESLVVELVTIDELVGDEQIAMIQLDVEGNEIAALIGAAKTIARCRPMLYLENDREDKQQMVLQLLDRMGYEALHHFAPLYNRRNFAGNPTNVFDTTASKSLLCLPRAA